MKTTKILTILVLALGLMVCSAKVSEATPMGTAFTYQGHLYDANYPANGLYDFAFKLYDDPCTGNLLAGPIEVNDCDVFDAYFTVELDFGSDVFDGNAVWLETTVAHGDGSDPCTLSPRQELTPVPYALQTRGIFVNNAGNVGIGTTSPATPLHVNGAISQGLWSASSKFFMSEPYTGDSWRLQAFKNMGTTVLALNPAGGNVGIGTTSPDAKLEVNGQVKITGGSPGAGKILTSDASGLASWQTPAGGGDNLGNHIATQNIRLNGHWLSGDGGNEGVFVDNVGNVGIGTTNPQQNLSVWEGMNIDQSNSNDGAIGPGLRFGSGSSGEGIASKRTPGENQYGLDFYAGVANRMSITSSGKVGIGTTNPVSKLEVNGRLELPGNDATGTAGTGVIEIGNSLRLDDNEIITNTDQTLYIQRDNNGDLSVDDGTLTVDASLNNVGIGTTSPTEKLTVRGNLLILSESTGATVMQLGAGLDYAEGFDVSESSKIDAGSVLIIDADNPGKLAISDKPYDSKVAGIVAGAKGQGSGVRLGGEQFDFDVALAGRVYCNVDATEAAVQPGDLLTTSATPGYAMKAADYMRAQGAILGKAMEKLEKGQKGQILVLVTLQ